jgi:sarcosine oxidase subunit alpha
VPRLPDARFAPDCTITVDGAPVPAHAGESVAVALLAAGRPLVARSAKYHRPRGPFCLAGTCHGCLARVEGHPNQRTCRVPCRDGLAVESQHGVPSARCDLLATLDALYARGLDHHHLMTWNGAANRAAVALSRRLAGLGTLPDRVTPRAPPPQVERFDALVVGGGPAGLGAAEQLAAAGRRVLLVESEARLGGRLRAALRLEGDPPPAWPAEVAAALDRASGEVALRATALGLWGDGGFPLAAIREDRGGRLRLVRAPHVVLATGTAALPPAIPRNDLPGVLAARGLAVALAEDGLVPGGRAAVIGDGGEASALAERLRAAGMEVRQAPDAAAAHGRSRVAAVSLGTGERIACDVLAFAGARAPASELPRAAGVPCELDPASGGFRARADARGGTGVPGLWVAGEVAGAASAVEAADAGRRAAEDAA